MKKIGGKERKKIQRKIKQHFKKTCFSRITRKVSKRLHQISRGYLVDIADDFVLLSETDEFKSISN